jgi:hypothetical protein
MRTATAVAALAAALLLSAPLRAATIGLEVEGGAAPRIFLNGATPVNVGAPEFDELHWGFNVADNARLWDSLWIEWTGGTLVFRQPGTGRTTMPASATREGHPFPSPIPAPMTFPLLLGALGALGLSARVRRAA